MNLLLLEESDLVAPGTARLTGRRLQHLHEVWQLTVGESLRVGLIGGAMGSAILESLSAEQAELSFTLTDSPPPKLPLTLILAMPRPKMFRRIMQHCATLGVPRIVLVNSYRVEKSFWQTPFLEEAALRQNLLLGLEQARDTILPEVITERRFKPFVEDRLAKLITGTRALVAHPGDYPPCPHQLSEPVTLAIGPEGGWIPYEVEKLTEAGFAPVQLGERILRVETAVTALIAKLF